MFRGCAPLRPRGPARRAGGPPSRRGGAGDRSLAARRPARRRHPARTPASQSGDARPRGSAEQFCCNGSSRCTRSSVIGIRATATGSSIGSRARWRRPASRLLASRFRRRAECRRRRPRASVRECGGRGSSSRESIARHACGWSKAAAVLVGVNEVRLNYGTAVAEVTWSPAQRACRRWPRARPAGYTPHFTARPAAGGAPVRGLRGAGPAGRGGACAMNLMFITGRSTPVSTPAWRRPTRRSSAGCRSLSAFRCSCSPRARSSRRRSPGSGRAFPHRPAHRNRLAVTFAASA